MSEYQEEVLTSLLDLQAELRGDEPEPHDEHPTGPSAEGPAASDAADGQERVAVTEEGVTVSISPGSSPDGEGVNERLAALHARLVHLEYLLTGVTKRIERLEPASDVVTSAGDPGADVDERWRSFLDLQKIVADRLDQH
jgi:hypothetical protein